MGSRFRNWDECHLGKILPRNRVLQLGFCLLLNCLIYWGTGWYNGDRVAQDVTTVVDRLWPLDSRWVLIYVAAYVFWGINYVLMAQGQDWNKVMGAEVCAKLICGVLFLLIPTTNVRPALGEGFCDQLLGLVYCLDRPANLFPSIHCLESWLCFRGIQHRWDIPKWYRDGSLVMAVMICLSTLFTKQHVVGDVLAGILLAEGMLRIWTGAFWFGRSGHRNCSKGTI